LKLRNRDRVTSLTRDADPVFDDIRQWFETPLGQHVVQTETSILEALLPGFFGYQLLQLSVQDSSLHDSSPIRQRFNVHLDDASSGGLVAHPAHLPFANDSIDTILLHHLLDFVESPQDVLREVSRITLPMGHLVIVGFNPWSSWGLWQGLAKFRGHAPWNGRYIRAGRLMDWLNLLNFKIDRAQYAIYRPPVARLAGKVSDYSHGLSRNLNLPVGAVYVIVARKHVGAVRSIRPVWRPSRAFGRLSVVRSIKHDGVTRSDHQGLKD
jgi:SAM-dependent methyltransferase